MWEKGISVYIGLQHSLDTNISYLKLAHHYGYTRLFTSLHIPEADPRAVVSDFRRLVSEAVCLGFAVTADISPRTFSLLGASHDDLSLFTEWGLSALRLDYGFSPAYMGTITSSSRLNIEINASTVTTALLEDMARSKVDFSRIQACHNYYPRPEAGLSWTAFAERSALLRLWGIPVFAFIPSLRSPRAPLFSGLPTVEKHRLVPPLAAAKEFLACQLLSGILFGDPMASEEDLASVAALDPSCLELNVVVEKDLSPAERAILFAPSHTCRVDSGEYAIRSQEARSLCKTTVPVRPAIDRPAGSVTIDNEAYGRYMGEMQVITTSLPADPRVNVAAHVIPEEHCLLSYIQPGSIFRLKEAAER